MEKVVEFDEKAIEGLEILLHQFWVLRAKQPEVYQLIRGREKVLRRYINEKFGLVLVIHQHFIKLEKIPVEPEPWMGMTSLTEQRDYALLCYAMAFLEDKSVDEQFLLSELAEEIKHLYQGDAGIDWTIYTHRKSLIRAMKLLTGMNLIREVDGVLQRFDSDQEQEVLYETTIYSKYFIRSFPDDLTTFAHWRDVLTEDWKLQQEDERRRKRVYRQLFFQPGMHRTPENDADFMYLRNFRNRLAEDIEKHSQYRLRLFKNTAFLSASGSNHTYDYYPDSKAVTDILLQLSHLFAEERELFKPLENGEILLTVGELDELFMRLKRTQGHGWSKYYREASLDVIRKEAIGAMESWMMASVDESAKMIYVNPLFGVLSGEYPDDYQAKKEMQHEE